MNGADRTAVDWLLESDPSIRWQVMRDLTDAPAGQVAAERGRTAYEGWAARVLAAQGADGRWGGSTFFPRGTGTVDEAARWDYDRNLRFWQGEVEPCINGRVVAIGAS